MDRKGFKRLINDVMNVSEDISYVMEFGNVVRFNVPPNKTNALASILSSDSEVVILQMSESIDHERCFIHCRLLRSRRNDSKTTFHRSKRSTSAASKEVSVKKRRRS
jgi:hypothetical protein